MVLKRLSSDQQALITWTNPGGATNRFTKLDHKEFQDFWAGIAS
jgi:hypothetical protein